MKQSDQGCKNCRFWEQEESDAGYCHRYPPKTIKLDDYAYDTLPPPLLTDDYWCGEWQERR